VSRERDIRNAYPIVNSRGDLITTIFEDQVDTTSTSLVLHGRGAPYYGFARDTNLVYLLENFASSDAPRQPLEGQLWWDTSDTMVYTGSPLGWSLLVPLSVNIGFNVVAGDGLSGGGIPTGSPLSVTIDLGAGTGITFTAPPSEVSHALLAVYGSPNEEFLAGDGTWQDFTKLDTTLAMSTLTTGDDYMIFYRTNFGNNASGNPTDDFIRVVEDLPGSPVLEIPFSKHRIEVFGQDLGQLYGFMTRFNATGNDLKLQAKGLTPGTPFILNPHALAISLTELGSNATYSEDTVGIANVPAGSPQNTGADITDHRGWSPTTAAVNIGDGSSNYIVFWCSHWQIDQGSAFNTYTTGIRETVGGSPLSLGSPRTFYGSPTNVRIVKSMGPGDAREFLVSAGFTNYIAPSSDTTLNIVGKTGGFGGFGGNHDLLYASICAINLNAFEDSFADYNDISIITFNAHKQLLLTQHRTSTSGPVDWGVLSGWQFSSGAGNPSAGYELQLGLNVGSPFGSPVTLAGAGSPGGVPNLHGDGTFPTDRGHKIFAIQPNTRGEAGGDLRYGSTVGEQTAVVSGTDMSFLMAANPSFAGAPNANQRSIAGFTWKLAGGSGGSPEFVATVDSEIIHDNLLNFVANEHIDHTSITLNAGAGLRGTGTIDSSLNIDVAGRDGITVNTNDIAVDSTVVRRSNDQTIGGEKAFTSQIRGLVSGTNATNPAFALGSTSNGWYSSASNQLSFTTDATQRFRIESNGILRSLNSTYESLVTVANHIPNKKYVDNVSATAVTENTFVGTSSLTGLDGNQTYLVSCYGTVFYKGSTGIGITLDGIRIRAGTTLGSGTVLASYPAVDINWPDGGIPNSGSFVVDMNGNTSLHAQINRSSTGGVNTYSTLITAVQLTDN
jgi:hypothetical protein